MRKDVFEDRNAWWAGFGYGSLFFKSYHVLEAKWVGKLFFCIIRLCLFGSLTVVPAAAETLSFPLQLDYPFLKALVMQSAFTDPGQTMIITDPNDDCRQISLSNPQFSGENHLLRIEVAVHLKGGSRMGSHCLLPVEWSGFLVAHMQPRVVPGTTWELFFDPVDSVLLDSNRRPDTLMGRLWDFFEVSVMSRMGGIRIAVNAPIDQLKPFLLSAVPEAEHLSVSTMLESLRPGSTLAEKKSLKIEILADIDQAVPENAPLPAPAPLTAAEIDDFINLWETWDAFLVQALMSLLDMPLNADECETLLDVLLETRYRFVSELETDTPDVSRDFVREEFLDAWEKLSPILKDYLSRHPSANSWGYLAFFTASDALAALDKLGPVFHIEISKNGLIRLARMLSENKEITLQYSPVINPELRKLLGMEMEPISEISQPLSSENCEKQPEQPSISAEEGARSADGRPSMLSTLCDFLTPPPCWADKSGAVPSLKELRYWLVNPDNIDAHLEKNQTLLNSTIHEHFQKNRISKNYQSMFEKTVYATAWQESCFRQFIVDKDKLTFIRSYNNSSVGIMQINERIWRGIYNIQNLRWNIRYNVRAGIEILNLYLKKYALPKMKRLKGNAILDKEGLAGSLYAMYNAGPHGFSTYVKRRSRSKPSKLDKQFKEKYLWVKGNQWDRLQRCFF